MKNAPGQIFKFVTAIAIAAPILIGLASGAEPRDAANPATSANAQKEYVNGLSKLGKPGEWNEPDKVLSQVSFDNLPITEVCANLKEEFENHFDVLLPFGAADTHWSETPVSLRLKNVKASEIFNAMNLVFETANTPLRWELMMNGHRPTALLRILPVPDAAVYVDPTTGLPHSLKQALAERPMVFFVGDLVGDPKAGGMTMEQLVETVSDVCKFALAGDHISSHKQTQLLIVRGTDADISFVQSTLGALRDKARLDEERLAQKKAAGPNSKPNEKTP